MADSSLNTTALDGLVTDLQAVFGQRLRCVAAYGGDGEAEALSGGGTGDARDHVHSLAVVDALDARDLQACAQLAGSWKRRGLATPLLMAAGELARSLDAFPLELGDILAHHRVVFGADVLAGLTVAPADTRRACEMQARSHLLHLREAFVESGAEPRALAAIVQQSARPFRLLLASIDRLEGTGGGGAHLSLEDRAGISAGLVKQVLASGGRAGISPTDAQAVYPAYVAAVDRLVQYVDGWKA